MPKRAAMSLIELVVVLAIMAAIASLTLTAAGDMLDRSRVDENERRGAEVARVVSGDGLTAGRFYADMGRLPHVRSTTEGETLNELFTEPPSLAYAVVSNADAWPETGAAWSGLPASISLGAGWRGPYLTLHRGTLYDGWGNPWQVDVTDAGGWTATPAADDPVYAIRSLGRDNQAGGTGWQNEDSEFRFVHETASLTVTLHAPDGVYPPANWQAVISSASLPLWTAGAAHAVGDVVRSTDGNHLFACVRAGTSETSEPTWDLSEVEAKTKESPPGVHWEYRGPTPPGYANILRVAVFAPYVTGSQVRIKRVLARRDGTTSLEILPPADAGYPHAETSVWSAFHSVRFENLTPGPRKVYAYGFDNTGGTPRNKRASGILTIQLAPGENVLAVYLADVLP